MAWFINIAVKSSKAFVELFYVLFNLFISSSSTAVTWLRDDQSATRADYYVTSMVMIRLTGSSQIDPLSQYHGIHDIEVYAG